MEDLYNKISPTFSGSYNTDLYQETQKKLGRKPTILQVLPALNVGGVERGVVEIADAASNAGFDSYVLSSGGRLVTNIEQGGSTHITAPVHSKNPIRILRNISLIKNIIQMYNIDLVDVHSRAPAWSVYFACKALKTPLLTSFHGHYGKKGGLLKRAYNSSMIKGDVVLAVSKHIARLIMAKYNVPKQKIRMIYRGVDVNYFNPHNVTDERINKVKAKWGIKKDIPIIFMPARITEWKGQSFFLNAIDKVDAGEYYCIIAGGGKQESIYYKQLQHQAIQQTVSSANGAIIKLLPTEEDMPAAILASNLVVAASLEEEAFGRIPIETMAMGRPIIATKMGGFKETILHKETGFLADIVTTEDLAEGVEWALNMDNFHREELQKNARYFVENNFSLEKMCNKTLNLYLELMVACNQ